MNRRHFLITSTALAALPMAATAQMAAEGGWIMSRV